jgi:hypothetical protein
MGHNAIDVVRSAGLKGKKNPNIVIKEFLKFGFVNE